MISFAAPLPIGNAVKLVLAPSDGAEKVRLLRKDADTFTGEADPAAFVVYEGDDVLAVDSDKNLVNGATYYYRLYEFDGSAWSASGPSASAVPGATAGFIAPDPLTVIRDRLERGLKIEVEAGRLKHEQGYVPCLTAPPAFEGTKFPIVTVHLDDDSPAYRGLGEMVSADAYDHESGWSESEGWESRYRINVVGWVVGNADARIALRRAIKKVLIGNLPIFSAAGMSEFEFGQSDAEDFESYNALVYQVYTPITCLAPSIVASHASEITDVTVDAQAA